ncbi:MAG: DUF108 domain-containing protein, partial [Candidatus Omnitrophica bacterium]|nr:DUF108 domain-containing protein [Candidatus Omnitrophota bacterium]
MMRRSGKLKLGIVGCGAIGSRIALSTKKELKNQFMVSALYDIDVDRAASLAVRLQASKVVKKSVDVLINTCDIVVECVNTDATAGIVRKSIKARKHILVMSVGRLLGKGSLFSLAEKNRASILIPSGAIAGLDAIKAAGLANIVSVTLTSRKPPMGFARNQYLLDRGIELDSIKKETVLFDGDVSDAVRYFPQNINVASALQMACGRGAELRVKIIADPQISRNTHEIVL